MVDIELLHLWRGSYTFGTNPQFQMMDQTRLTEAEQKMFARSAGTAERFRIRIHEYGSLTALTVRFKINGAIVRTIGPVPVGQLGVKLPANQLPVAFAKNDELVMDIIGPDGIGINRIEWNVDLKFIEDVIPPGGIPLESNITLRLEIQGSSFNLPHQFSHYTNRPLDIGSSTAVPPATILGRKITHIRCRTGTAQNSNGIYLAVYEGPTKEEATLKSHTLIHNHSTMLGSQTYDVPLVVPYIIGTDKVDEIYICTAVVGGSQVEMRGDSLNSARTRITYGFGGSGFANAIPPDWPVDFTMPGLDSLANEAPEQRLINEDTIIGGLLPIPP